MSLATNIFKTALVIASLAIAACGSDTSASQTSPTSGVASTGSTVAATSSAMASSVKAAAAAAASPGGTTIPSATKIVDASGNVWTVSAGVVYENGALAGYSKNVSLLEYSSALVYQENTSGGWWSWNGSTWVASSAPTAATATSPNGTEIPTVSQIVDSSHNVWTLSGGKVYENGAAAGYTKGAAALIYENGNIYQENTANNWYEWKGGSWASTKDPIPTGTTPPPPVAATGSATLTWTAPTQNTNGTTLTDLAGYRIYYGTSAGSLTQTVQVANASAITYTVNNLSAGTYYFAIAAYASDGTQSAQTPVGSLTIS